MVCVEAGFGDLWGGGDGGRRDSGNYTFQEGWWGGGVKAQGGRARGLAAWPSSE